MEKTYSTQEKKSASTHIMSRAIIFCLTRIKRDHLPRLSLSFCVETTFISLLSLLLQSLIFIYFNCSNTCRNGKWHLKTRLEIYPNTSSWQLNQWPTYESSPCTLSPVHKCPVRLVCHTRNQSWQCQLDNTHRRHRRQSSWPKAHPNRRHKSRERHFHDRRTSCHCERWNRCYTTTGKWLMKYSRQWPSWVRPTAWSLNRGGFLK